MLYGYLGEKDLKMKIQFEVWEIICIDKLIAYSEIIHESKMKIHIVNEYLSHNKLQDRWKYRYILRLNKTQSVHALE